MSFFHIGMQQAARMLRNMKNHAEARGSKRLQRLTVSLPEDLVKRIKHISQERGLKISRIVATALEQQLSKQTRQLVELSVHPTILWKPKGRSLLKAPSPTLRTKPAGSWRIIELDKLPV